jgi:predicted dinucleotide-binding enzyme
LRIAVVGKGNVGGGLADLWEKAGHDVQRIGRAGGDVTDADVVLVAIPGASVPSVFDTVKGLGGKTVIDATNLVGDGAPDGFASNAEYIKSRTGGPTAKSFNLNFASMYGQIAGATTAPGNVWCGDAETRGVVEQLNRDAGYDPIYAGGLENAAISESALQFLFAIAQGGLGQYFYRMAAPESL